MDFKAQSTPFTFISDDKGNGSSKPKFFQKLRAPFSNFSPKKGFAIGLTIFVLFALALGVYLSRKPTQLSPQAGGGGVSITLKPETQTVAKDQEFNIDVTIDAAQTFEVTAVQAKINYDATKLQLVSTTSTGYLPVALQDPQASSGSVQFIFGASPSDPKKGAGSIATLKFKSLIPTSNPPPQTQVAFDQTKTQIAALNFTTSLAKDFTPATVVFGPISSSNPSPSPSTSTTPEVSLTLAMPVLRNIGPNQEFQVGVYSRSDTDNANLWRAQFTFPANLLEVISINKTESFITTWTEEYKNNTTGEVSLTGGVTSPGFKTNNTQALMAIITFKAKAAGTGNLNFTNASAIYRNSDNAQILQTKRNLAITIASTASPSPIPFPSGACDNAHACPNGYTCTQVQCVTTPCLNVCLPTPSTSPSPSPSGNKGDGNNDGRVDLQDLSIMFTKWSPVIDIISHFQLDFNNDKRINSADYGLMRELLIQLGVIRL